MHMYVAVTVTDEEATAKENRAGLTQHHRQRHHCGALRFKPSKSTNVIDKSNKRTRTSGDELLALCTSPETGLSNLCSLHLHGGRGENGNTNYVFNDLRVSKLRKTNEM